MSFQIEFNQSGCFLQEHECQWDYVQRVTLQYTTSIFSTKAKKC